MNPTPGQPYTVESGDDFETIAIKAYGNLLRGPDIAKANQGTLKSTDWKFVEEGTVIIIPILPEFEAFREAQRA